MDIRYMLIQLSHGYTGIYLILFRISQVTDFNEMYVYVCAFLERAFLAAWHSFLRR